MLTLTKLLQNTRILCPLRLQASNQCATISTRRLEEKLGLPAKPNKPFSPYRLFANQLRSKLKQENPDLNPKEITKMCVKQWAVADKEVKKRIKEEALIEKQEYEKKLRQYNSQITDEQRKSFENILGNIQEKKLGAQEKREFMKVRTAMGCPKKPKSPFFRFSHEQMSKYGKDVRAMIKSNGALWNKLSDSEKQVYLDAHKKEISEYKEKLAKWETDMLNSGKAGLVRKKSMIESFRKDAFVDSSLTLESNKKIKTDR